MPGVSGNTGVYSYSQLEQLWTAAGGSARMAPLMAAIAEAESGGNPRAYNSSGASGLWQILGTPFAGNVWDPLTNARMAVAKYREQGLDAWQTYTNGSYRKFLQGGRAPDTQQSGASDFVHEVEKFIGTPYVWGGDKPGGFDCSGLVFYALQQVGIKNPPRTSEEQWAWVKHISRDQLQAGDLVFYAGSDGTASSPGHVAIYVGNGQVVQAPHTGEDVQRTPLADMGQAAGYGRVPGISGASGGGGGGGGGGLLSELEQVAGFGFFSLIGQSSSDVANALKAVSNNLLAVEEAIAWFLVPNHWVRIICGIAGTLLVSMGLVNIARTGQSYSVSAPGIGQVPATGGQVAPAVGIAEVTVGAMMLFVALHNLPANVSDVPTLMSYLQGQVQHGGRAA